MSQPCDVMPQRHGVLKQEALRMLAGRDGTCFPV